jgi:eukaryotic-like serine/threonine-protein kinase
VLTAGRRISHYALVRPLGKGGMGEVWLAHDADLDRQVAIKFLPEDIRAFPGARERFVREARAAAALDHPFICKIYETGESEGIAYIVMEYVEGRDLRNKLQEQKLSVRDALQVALEVAEALEIAHAKGIVHRDLKPANIMCTVQGHTKVMDFGIAKRILPSGNTIQATITQSAMTQEGAIMGTIDYMSPEQAKGAPVDGRSDIFSLGVILQEMITGRHPFSRPTPVETLSSVLKDQAPPFTVKPKALNPLLHHVLKKCLAKNPAERYPSIAALEADLRNARDEIGGGLPSFLKGWRGAAAAALVLALLGVVVWRVVKPPPATGPPPAVEPVSVLVADFENATGDPAFSGAVEQALVLGLEDAPFINIYKREDARRKAGQMDAAAGGRLDPKLGRLVCRSDGIPVLIEGTVAAGSGGGFTVKVRAVNPVDDKVIVEKEKSASKKSEVMSAAASIAPPLCASLSGGAYDARKQLAVETFTTSSPEAMGAYAHAQELMKQGKRAEAVGEYERAIQADPSFGRAYSGLAVSYYNAGEPNRAEEYQKMALAHLDTMNDREKIRTRGVWYLITKNHQKAIEEFSALVRQFPGDSAGHSNLAFAYFQAREMTKAMEQGRFYTKAFPSNINGQYNLSWYALGAGDMALALEQVQKTLALNPKFEKIHICAALAELAQGRDAEAEAWYKKLEPLGATGASFAALGLADLALYRGCAAAAVAILEKGIEADMAAKKPDLAAEKWVAIGQARLLRGQVGPAVEAADHAAALIADVNILVPAAEIWLQAGRRDKALAAAGALRKRLEPEPQAFAKIIEGRIAEKESRFADALRAYAEARVQIDTWLGRLFAGEAYLAAGAFAEAHSEFEACLKRRGEAASVFLKDVPTFRYFPRVYYDLGRVQEGLKSPRAKASFEAFLKIKARDEGDPLVAEAKKRAAGL